MSTKLTRTQKRIKKAKAKLIKARNKAQEIAGRIQFKCSISSEEWGNLIHNKSVKYCDINANDIYPLKCALLDLEDKGIHATVKERQNGSLVIVNTPAALNSAEDAYDDGLLDPLDIMSNSGMPESTEFLGFTICDCDGKFLGNDGVSFVAKNAGWMLLSDQLDAEKLCSTFKSSFVSMAFKNNNNIALAVVQPS